MDIKWTDDLAIKLAAIARGDKEYQELFSQDTAAEEKYLPIVMVYKRDSLKAVKYTSVWIHPRNFRQMRNFELQKDRTGYRTRPR